MIPNHEAAAQAVAEHIEGLLPPLQTVAEIEDPGDLGPSVSVPAIYLHIILQAYRGERLGRHIEKMEATIARAKPVTDLTDDEYDALSVYLATEADARCARPIEAATALWKAAATIAVCHMPKETILTALDGIHAMTRADVAQAVGMGATKQ